MKRDYLKKTPCIGICSTTYGDQICRGCKRFAHEVTGWVKYGDAEKDIVNKRLEQFKITILQEKFEIIDDEKFKEFLRDAKILFNQELNPICWIFDLLRASSHDDLNLESFGIKVTEQFSDYTLLELKDLINTEFFDLSVAHYDRYINNSFT